MKKILISQLCAKEAITSTQLLEEVKRLLNDEFIAKIVSNNEKLTISFLNGQSFELGITEKNRV